MSLRDIIAVAASAFFVVGMGLIYFPLGLLSTGALLGWICYKMPAIDQQENS